MKAHVHKKGNVVGETLRHDVFVEFDVVRSCPLSHTLLSGLENKLDLRMIGLDEISDVQWTYTSHCLVEFHI